MRQHNLTIFDEFIPSGASSSGSPLYTSTEYNSRLGQLNQIALQVVIDNVTGTNATFDAIVQHSADGRIWLQKNPSSGAGAGEISFNVTNGYALTNTTNSAMWSDACEAVNKVGGEFTGPLLAFVRVALFFGTGFSGHVRIHATLRDR